MNQDRQEGRQRFHRTRILRWAKWAGGAVVAYAFLGFVALPPLTKHFGARAISEATGRVATIGGVEFNPFALSATVRDFALAGADASGPDAAFDTLTVNLESASIVRGGPVLSEITLNGLRVALARDENGRYNWADVIERLAAGPEGGGGARFSLNNIRLSDAAVRFEDRPAGQTHMVDGIEIGIPFLSNLPAQVDVFVEPRFEARINGRPLGVTGRTRPFSADRETIVDIVLDGLDLPPFMAYLPFEPRFRLPEGRLSTRLEIAFAQPEGAPTSLTISGGVELAALRLEGTKGEPMLSLASMVVDLAQLRPLDGEWRIERVAVDAPVIDVTRLADGRLSLEALAPPPDTGSATAKPTAEPSSPVRFRIEDARITGGTVRFEDRTNPEVFRTELRGLALAVEKLGNGPDDRATVALDFTTAAGEKVSLRDAVTLSPFTLAGRVEVGNLQLPRYAPYYQPFLSGAKIGSGRLDAVLRYRMNGSGEAATVELDGESMTLGDFVLALDGQTRPFARLPRFSANGIAVRPGERKIRIERVRSDGAAVALTREADGGFDVQRLVPAAAAAPDASAGSGAPWIVTVGDVAIEDASLRLDDKTPGFAQVVQLDSLRLAVRGFETTPGARTEIEFGAQVNRAGWFDIAGKLGLEPLVGDLRIGTKKLDLRFAQPYLSQALNLRLRSGRLDTDGRLRFALAEGGDVTGNFGGRIGLSEVAATEPRGDNDLLRVNALDVSDVDVDFAPLAITVGDIALSDFFARLVLDEQGRMNLREIRPVGEGTQAHEAAPAPTAEVSPPADVPPIEVGAIRIEKGNIAFSDRFIRPNYDANLTGMEGTLTGLSSDPTTLAKLKLQGSVDNAAPVSVEGELNPFRDDRRLEIAASVKGFELPAVSAYSGKYVGYGIEKGKLSADLVYRVEDRKLTATNRVFLDQLTFGSPVDSPDAVNLPVQLAVSLLQNRNGEIDLNVPVSGSLDDPEFSVGGLVFKALMNLIGKAITAPFALLGSLFGGEELSYVEFDPGRAVLSEAATTKVGTLAKALIDRPGLRLEITGQVERPSDTQGLKQLELERRVKAAKAKRLAAMGQRVERVDDVPLTSEDYPEWLERVYRDANFERPRNAFGLLRDLPVPEMEMLLLKNITIDDVSLRELAEQRADTVREQLLKQGGIDPQRLFTVSPKVAGEGGAAADAGRRARFSLR